MNVEFRHLDADSREEWDAFVRAHPDGTFFHLSGWRDVLRRAFGHEDHYLSAVSGGRIVGIIPLAHVRSFLFGNALVSTPFCVYGGALGMSAQVVSALEDQACRLAERLQVDFLELRNRTPTRPDWPTKQLYVTFRKAITADHETNLAAVPRKQRAMIRKGIAAGLASSAGTDVDTLYAMYSASLRNLGTPVFGRRYLVELLNAFGSDCEVLAVSHKGTPVASVMSFFFRDEVLPYYGGGCNDARAVAANDFMYWEVMRRAAERGSRIFDYGRSKAGSGSFRFKEHWGFEPQPLAYQYHLVRAREMPNLSPTNPRYRRAIELWRRLPLRLTQLIGPPVAKYLG